MKRPFLIITFISFIILSSCIFDTDSNAPTVTITYPANNTTVSGVVIIRADANDNKGVTSVKFYIDGSLKITDTNAPWEYEWNTAAYTDEQQHTILAKAMDEAGNEGSSSLITVTVTSGMPTVSTSSVIGITSSSAISGGTVTNEGFSAVTNRGVCWSTVPNPTILDSMTSDGGGTGTFTSEIGSVKYFV